MRISLVIISLLLFTIACNSKGEEKLNEGDTVSDKTIVFDQAKWKTKVDSDYPYRHQMLNDVVYNDTVRTLNLDEILELLGKPDRSQDNHLYYLISQKRIGQWPMHTKTMVINFSDYSTIEWIKIHN